MWAGGGNPTSSPPRPAAAAQCPPRLWGAEPPRTKCVRLRPALGHEEAGCSLVGTARPAVALLARCLLTISIHVSLAISDILYKY